MQKHAMYSSSNVCVYFIILLVSTANEKPQQKSRPKFNFWAAANQPFDGVFENQELHSRLAHIKKIGPRDPRNQKPRLRRPQVDFLAISQT